MTTIQQTPTIALLGATGKTGREVLKVLLEKEIYDLKIYVRNRGKLIAMFPQIASNPRIQLFVGAITDQKVEQDCLRDCPIIICAIGGYSFFPDTSLRVSGRSIVAALQELRERSNSWQRPRMIYLSSSSRNERFAAARPPLVHWLIETAFQNGYNDLKLAHKAILADPSLVSVLLVQPAVLVEEPGSGYEISAEEVKLGCSYEDLGGAFVELAMERSYDNLHEVGVSSSQGDRVLRYLPITFGRIFAGLFAFYVPGALQITNALGSALSWVP